MTNPYESPKTVSRTEPVGVPALPIEIEGYLTVADVMAARRLMIDNYGIRLLISLILLSTFSFLIFLFLSSSYQAQTFLTTVSFATAAMFFPAIIFMRIGLARYRLVKMARTGTGIFMHSRAVFSADKIETSNAVSKAEYQWEAFSGYRAGKTVIVMVSKASNIQMIIAQRKTSSDSDWQGLHALVQSKLPPC